MKKATAYWLSPLFGAALLTSLAHAQPCPPPYIPQAPDACGPGSWCANPCGMVYGPNYYLVPPFPPFNGMVIAPGQNTPNIPPAALKHYPSPPGFMAAAPRPQNPGNPGPYMGRVPCFPSHPFARSPRDYFMVDD